MLTKVLSVVCVLVVLSGALLAEEDVVVEFEDTGSVNSNSTGRDKRTIGVVLRNVADLFGYDVQKRPTAIPPSMAPAAAPAPAPAMPMNRQAPPRLPLLPPAPPLPVLPPPVTFPPILQEQVRKTFNINFNWNKSSGQGVAVPVKPAAPAPAQPAAVPAAPQPPPRPAAPRPPQPASLPDGPISSGPKRPVTKAQLYTEYEYLYPPLGTAPPAPKYVRKKYNYKYGPIKTVTNYNDEPEPSHDAPLNEREETEIVHNDDNYEDYENGFQSREDDPASPEAGRKEQYKNNVRNFWEKNRWALHDSGYKYIAPEAQQQQNFQQDYPKEILTVKESNYYKPLQPLKKVKFQDYYVTQAVQPKRPAEPLPTQDISQFKKYYVQSSVPKLDLPPVQILTQPPEPLPTARTEDERTISPHDLNRIVQQLVKLTQQARNKQQNAAVPAPAPPLPATTLQPEVLSKYEEYNLPPSKEYYPSSTEVTYVNPYNPRQKKLEKEKSLVNKKEFSNAYKEEKHQPTLVEHDFNIFNTVTGNEIPYDERKFEDFKQRHGYHSPVDAEIPKPIEKESSAEVAPKEDDSNSAESKEKQEQNNSSQEEDNGSKKEPIDDDYVANVRKPQNTPTEEHIETTSDEKAKVQNVKEPVYDSYNDYEEQNDAPAPTNTQSSESAEEEDEEEKQNTAKEEDDDEEEQPQRQQYYHRDYDYPQGKNEEAEDDDYDENSEEESRVNLKVKKIISVEPKPVETDVIPTPSYQYFTFKNRKILQFEDPDEKSEKQKQEKKEAQTTLSPDYEDFSYKPGSTLALAEEAQATEEKEEEEEEEEEEPHTPPTYVTEKIPDYEQVKSSIKKTKTKTHEDAKPKRKEESRRGSERSKKEEEKSPVQQLREQNVFTYAPTNPFVDQGARVGQETQEVKSEKQKANKDKKKKKKEKNKYVELSDFLERYDDFDYLREIDKEKEGAEEEDAESSKLRLSILDKPTQNTQESRVREVRSEKAENQTEESTTEANKFFDNYKIFQDFFKTSDSSHEEDDEEEEEEPKNERPSLSLPGYSKLYEEFDYTKKPDLFSETATEAGKKEDNKEKKESSSDNHDQFNYFTPHQQQQEKPEGDKENANQQQQPQEGKKKEKVDNPYSIPTEFDLSHYTNPKIPDIPDFILEEEKRQQQLAKLRLPNGQLRPGVRVKKVRKRPGGGGQRPAVRIVPVNTNINPRRVVPNAAFRPIETNADNPQNAEGSRKVETLYSGLQPNQLHELSKVDKTLPLTIPFDYDYSGSEVVQKTVALQRRKRDAPESEAEAFTYVPDTYDRDFSYTIPEPAPQSYEQLEKKDHPDDEPLSEKARVYTSEEGKLKGHIRADEDSTLF